MASFFVCFMLLFHSVFGAIKLEQYSVEPDSLTVSGISAGGAMATQYHVIESAAVNGVGVVAGLPYDCALGLLAEATTCMSFPLLTNVNNLITRTENKASAGSIDPTSNMANDRVYIFHGTEDSVVKPGNGENVEKYYAHYTSNIKTVFELNAEHCFPTHNYGTACNRLNSISYINNCDYKGAFDMLNYLYGGNLVEPTGTENLAALREFDQSEFLPAGAVMDDTGFVYVPTGCADKSIPCKLHVSFHGCKQARQEIDDVFAKHAGYLEVAEANNIIVLFPQAVKNFISNPNGCFDWWGYTNNAYSSRDGIQITAVRDMVNRISYGQ